MGSASSKAVSRKRLPGTLSHGCFQFYSKQVDNGYNFGCHHNELTHITGDLRANERRGEKTLINDDNMHAF